MPRRPALVLAFALAAVVGAIPVDEITARNGIGGQADGGSLPAAASNMSEFSGISLLKTASGKHTWIISLHASSYTLCRECREPSWTDRAVDRFGKR